MVSTLRKLLVKQDVVDTREEQAEGLGFQKGPDYIWLYERHQKMLCGVMSLAGLGQAEVGLGEAGL